MPSTSFSPWVHGFHFNNNFANKIVGKISLGAGRCGGMAYLALDYYSFGLPVPSHNGADFQTPDQVPPDGSRLADAILSRLFDSWQDNASTWLSIYGRDLGDSVAEIVGVLTGEVLPLLGGILDSWLSQGSQRADITTLTARAIPAIRDHIDHGHPVALALVGSTRVEDIGNNHVVVATGYTQTGDELLINLYDNNRRDQSVTLRTNSRDPRSISYSTGEAWIGFFPCSNYSPKRPSYRDLAGGLELAETGPVRQSWEAQGDAPPNKPHVYHLVSTQLQTEGAPLRAQLSIQNIGQYAAHYRTLELAPGDSGQGALIVEGRADTVTTLAAGPPKSFKHEYADFGIGGAGGTVTLSIQPAFWNPNSFDPDPPKAAGPSIVLVEAVTVLVPKGYVPPPPGPPPAPTPSLPQPAVVNA